MMISCCLLVLLWFQASPGAIVDVAPFSYSREIPAAPPGLSMIVLDAAVLGHSQTDLGDVRIVNSGNEQIPYLLEESKDALQIPLSPVAAPDETPPPGHTYYRIVLPFENLPKAGMILATDERLFQRTVQIRRKSARPDPRSKSPWVMVSSASWQHKDPETAATPLELPLPDRLGTSELLLDIEEGDNRPLTLGNIHLRAPTYQLRFFHPGDEPLTLLYGHENLSSPRYDIALLATELSAEESRRLPLGEERDAAGSGKNKMARYVLWTALVAAVAAILGTLIRLLRSPASV